MLKVREPFGDPVELGEEDALELGALLVRLAERRLIVRVHVRSGNSLNAPGPSGRYILLPPRSRPAFRCSLFPASVSYRFSTVPLKAEMSEHERK
jgi:hypothetical protein